MPARDPPPGCSGSSGLGEAAGSLGAGAEGAADPLLGPNPPTSHRDGPGREGCSSRGLPWKDGEGGVGTSWQPPPCADPALALPVASPSSCLVFPPSLLSLRSSQRCEPEEEVSLHPCASSGPSVEALPPLPPCWGASQGLSPPPAEIWHPELPQCPPPLTGPQRWWLLGPPLTWDRITDQNFKAHPRSLLLWAAGVLGLSRDGYNWKPVRGEEGARSSCPEGPK